MGNQLKYADQRNSPCVIIRARMKARGECQIKDLIEGAKAAAAVASTRNGARRGRQFSPAPRARSLPGCAKC
jgi:histidyl-tRNA synthetase